MPKLHELMERRAHVVSEMRSINENAEKETRDYTADEDRKHGELNAELAALDKKIERARDLQEAERSAPAILHSGRLGDGDFETRARDFQITRAIRAAIGDRVDDGFEREMSAELRRRTGREFAGIPIPDQVFQVERRTLLAGSTAADLVPNVHRPDLFIDRLRSALIVGRLGATVLDGLVGTVDIPKQTGSSTAQWVAEDGSLTETDAAFTDVNLTPKTVGAMTSYSRRTLLNAVPSIEGIVRNDLAAVVAGAIDIAALTGDGTGNTPVGVTHSGATQLSFATPSWAEALDFPVHSQNLDADLGGGAWATTPYGVKLLMSTQKLAGSAELGFIMNTPTDLAGYPVQTTTALRLDNSPETAQAIFGYWSQLLVGYWSGLDLLVNPYETTAYAKGRVLVRAMRDCDVAVRHVESFSFATNLAV